ncbi:MAG: HAD family hydrolase [Proteobacteria bacterium]|nr:HAD family hydrolase [Pseudomonadota bacterium]
MVQEPHHLLQQKPQAVLFDWDNTLVDSWQLLHTVLNLTLKSYGMPEWSEEEVTARSHRSMREAFPHIFGDQWEEAGRKFHQIYQEVHLDYLQALPGAEAVLTELCRIGVYLSIVSNKTGKFLRKEVEVLGWGKYFDMVVGATDTPKDKPAIDMPTKALENLPHYEHSKVWLVGDTKIDLECASNFGCRAVLFGVSKYGHHEELLPMADGYIPDHANFLELLKGYA